MALTMTLCWEDTDDNEMSTTVVVDNEMQKEIRCSYRPLHVDFSPKSRKAVAHVTCVTRCG